MYKVSGYCLSGDKGSVVSVVRNNRVSGDDDSVINAVKYYSMSGDKRSIMYNRIWKL